MFLAGVGFNMLVYFCATGLKEMYVVNNNEKGGPISQIDKITYKFNKFKDNVFLDRITGDYFSFNNEINQWVPMGNVGIHYSRAVEAIDNKSSEHLKMKHDYKPSEAKYSIGLFTSKLSEAKCCAKKNHINHWLFEGMKTQFIVENKSAWDVHAIKIGD